MINTLTWFANIWIGIWTLSNIVAIVAFFVTADTLWHGLLKFWEIYSPWNVVNLIIEGLMLSPAVLAMNLRDRLSAKRRVVGLTRA